MLKTQAQEWIERLPEIELQLRSLPDKPLDRGAIEIIFGLKRRSALRLMKDFGASGIPLKLSRAVLIEKLREFEQEETAEELERRKAFAQKFLDMRKDRIERPRLEISAPAKVVNTRISQLQAANITLEPGKITIQFDTPEEAGKKLLLLCMAMARDLAEFEERVNTGGTAERGG